MSQSCSQTPNKQINTIRIKKKENWDKLADVANWYANINANASLTHTSYRVKYGDTAWVTDLIEELYNPRIFTKA